MMIFFIIAVGAPFCLVLGTIVYQELKKRPKKPKKLSRKEKLAVEAKKSSQQLLSLALTKQEEMGLPLKKFKMGSVDWNDFELEGDKIIEKGEETFEFLLPRVPAGVFWKIEPAKDKEGSLSLQFRQSGGVQELSRVPLPAVPKDKKAPDIILGASFVALELADKYYSNLVDVYVVRPKKPYSEFAGEFE